MSRFFRLLVLAGAAVVLPRGPLRAQSDEQLLATYRLTDAALTKFVQASRNIIAAGKADPALFREEDDDEEDEATIADIAAVYDQRAPLKRAISSAGLTTREYVTFMLSMFQAGVASWIVKQQQGKFDNVPASIPRENVLFYQRHEPELDRIAEELKALSGEKDASEPPTQRR